MNTALRTTTAASAETTHPRIRSLLSRHSWLNLRKHGERVSSRSLLFRLQALHEEESGTENSNC